MFDPFDMKHHCAARRRKPGEVAFEKRQWEERVAANLRRAIEHLECPEYVKFIDVLDAADELPETNLPRATLTRNAVKAMKTVGYEKMPNPRSKDGRWQFEWGTAVIYRRSGAKILDKWEVKDVLG